MEGRRKGSISFRKEFPISVSVVPVLGPLEHQEPLVQPETVQRDHLTHRGSRHFRSFWYQLPDGFDRFAALIERTWPGMQVQRPEVTDVQSGSVGMFCLERRITRELYWAGFGFQVWCQLLSHAVQAAGSTVFVIDEPEIYLHADVQRQLGLDHSGPWPRYRYRDALYRNHGGGRPVRNRPRGKVSSVWRTIENDRGPPGRPRKGRVDTEYHPRKACQDKKGSLLSKTIKTT